MYIPFDQMPAQARVWVYQSVSPFSAPLEAEIVDRLKHFAEGWESHGVPLRASSQVLHKHFVVLAVDESVKDASGCSIDKSVHFLQMLRNSLGVDLFDRAQQAFLVNDQVRFVEVKNLKNQIQSGDIHSDTPTFNNLVATVEQLRNAWLVPAQQSWLVRYFRQVPQA